jgi:dolichyl-phosphate-mannose-protein mannosyltransferase
MYRSNITLTSYHPARADPWSWLVMGRPTPFFYQGPTLGQKGCTVAQCSQEITALGNPVIWWGATLAIVVLLFQWALRRDWRAGAVLAGLLGGYVPWFQFQQRTIFNFYSIAFTPWVVLALAYLLGLMLGRSDAGPTPVRRRSGPAQNWSAGRRRGGAARRPRVLVLPADLHRPGDSAVVLERSKVAAQLDLTPL